MSNPGMDMEIWKQLKKKWAALDAAGHKVKIDFRLLADVNDDKNILAIDVIQNVDEDVFTETVQRKAGEAFAMLGTAGLSAEQLVEVYKEVLGSLLQPAALQDVDLIVTMSPSSSTSGETRAYIKKRDSGEKSSMLVTYPHYYLLNALRERMIEQGGVAWRQAKAVYHSGELELHFEY